MSSIAAALLAGCGGGGGDSTSTDGASSFTAAKTTYAAVKPTQGDTITYTEVNTPSGGASTSFLVTGYWKTVNADGSAIYTNTISANNYIGNITNYDSTGAEVSRANFGNLGSSCTYSPGIRGGAIPPYSVGQTWNNSLVETCINGGVTNTYDVTDAGSITALESITEGSATFNALKSVFTVTSKDRATGTIYKTDETCWRDTVLGRNVKCDITRSMIASGATTATVTSTTTLDLVRYNAAGIPGSVADPSVYAGGWTASYTGTDSGGCASITVLATGAISGTCTSNTGTSFTISGMVNAQGSSSFTQGSAATDATFSGQLTPLSGSGTWSTLSGGSGSWTITHR